MTDEERLLAKVRSDVLDIDDNLAKRQYLNASTWAAAMVPDLLKLFSLARRAEMLDSPRGGTDQPSPPDAGPRTTVQGGGDGGVPAGWKLAPGWHVRHPEDYSECTWGLTRWQSGCQLRHAFQGDNGMACPVHAERMGAILKVEPPAGQISDSPTAAAGVGKENTDPRAIEGGLGTDQRHSLQGYGDCLCFGRETCSICLSAAARAAREHDETCATRAGTSRNCDCATPEPASRQGERLSERMRSAVKELKVALVVRGDDGRLHSPSPTVLERLSAFRALAEEADALEAKFAAAERERDELRRENARLGAQVDAWRIASDEARK